MKKALVIANMVFASVAVFGTPLEKTEEKIKSDSGSEILMIVSNKELSETKKIEQVNQKVANVLLDKHMILSLLNMYKNKQEYGKEDFSEYIYSLRKKSIKPALDYKKDDGTPLYTALINKETNLAKLLVDLGADINSVCSIGDQTPLDVAVRMANRDMIEYLLKHGAGKEKGKGKVKHGAGGGGKKAVIIAAIKEILFDGSKNAMDILEQETKEYIDLDIIKKKVINLGAFGYEIAKRQNEIWKIFKKNNPNYDAKNPEAAEFLKYLVNDPHLLVSDVTYSMTEWLLEKGANPDAVVDSDGNTLLMSAVKRIEVPYVKYLIKYGANIDATNSSGQTAYGIAEENKEYFQKRYPQYKNNLEEIDRIIGILETHKEQLKKNALANQ